MGDLILREATEANVPTVVALIRAAFQEYRGQLDPPSGALDETAERVRQNMARARVALAWWREEPVGCVFYEQRKDALYFYRLAVLPAHRRRGIGRALINYVETQARTLGLTYVRLGVRLALVPLRAYYERLGYRFVEYGRHEGYTEPTYVTLEKQWSRAPRVEED
jgi:GNAT superfamily N-acetyltransferase